MYRYLTDMMWQLYVRQYTVVRTTCKVASGSTRRYQSRYIRTYMRHRRDNFYACDLLHFSMNVPSVHNDHWLKSFIVLHKTVRTMIYCVQCLVVLGSTIYMPGNVELVAYSCQMYHVCNVFSGQFICKSLWHCGSKSGKHGVQVRPYANGIKVKVYRNGMLRFKQYVN